MCPSLLVPFPVPPNTIIDYTIEKLTSHGRDGGALGVVAQEEGDEDAGDLCACGLCVFIYLFIYHLSLCIPTYIYLHLSCDDIRSTHHNVPQAEHGVRELGGLGGELAGEEELDGRVEGLGHRHHHLLLVCVCGGKWRGVVRRGSNEHRHHHLSVGVSGVGKGGVRTNGTGGGLSHIPPCITHTSTKRPRLCCATHGPTCLGAEDPEDVVEEEAGEEDGPDLVAPQRDALQALIS